MNAIHETKLHGKRTFPFTVYHGNLPEYYRIFPLHWHDEMELIPIVSGQGFITVQNKKYHVHTGDLILIPPQTVHAIEQKDQEVMQYFTILFRFSLLEQGSINSPTLQALHDHRQTIPFHLPAGDPLNQLLTPYIRNLTDFRKDSTQERQLMIRSNLLAIVYHLLCHSAASSTAERALHSAYDKLKPVLFHVQEHYPEQICVEQAAALCGFSPSHFQKLFRDLTGTSFTQYVKQFRLETAADLLLHSDKKVTEIAEDVGFRNFSYFTRAFSETYGLPPLQYRKKEV